MGQPRVSVLLPVYGDEPFLDEALASVAGQTYDDFEVVVVVESPSASVRETLSNTPLPLTRVEYTGPDGLVGALNAGLERAAGTYIARMDADDVATEQRLALQVAFLDTHPSVGVVGSAYERIDLEGRSHGVVRPPETHLGIRWRLLLTSCIPHPTSMIRRSVLDETGIRYRPAFGAVEDFDFWTQLATQTRLRNIRQPLLRYRIEGEKKSGQDPEAKQRQINTIVTREIGDTVPALGLSDSEVVTLRRFLHEGATDTIDKRRAAENYLRLLSAFERTTGSGSKEVRTDAAVTLARGLLRPPVQPAALPILVTLCRLSPRYPVSLLQFLLARRVLSRL